MMNIQVAWDSYLLHLSALKKSDATIKQYAIDGKQFVGFIQDQHYLEVDTKMLATIFVLYREQLQKRYASSQSINRKLAALRGFVLFAVMRGWLEESIAKTWLTTLLKPIPKANKEIFLLSSKDISAIKHAVHLWVENANGKENRWIAIRNQCLVATFLTLGLKPSEVVKMKGRHLFFSNQTCIILKESHPRKVKIHEDFCKILEQFKEATVAIMGNIEEDAYLWVSESNKKGQPITVKTIERVMQQLSKETALKVTATSLRYAVLHEATIENVDTNELIKQFGYARKWILDERQGLFQQ